MFRNRQICFAAVLALLGCLSQSGGVPLPAPDAKVGLDDLVRMVQERDPELAALRREVLDVEAAGVRDLRPREPQLRLGYSSTSHSTVPDPYTEVRDETVTANESYSGQRIESGSGSSAESRRDRSPGGDASETRRSSTSYTERDQESGSSNQTTTRSTVREITPGRRSTSILETVYETTNESFSESARRSGSTSGSETRTPTGPGDATRFSMDASSDRSSSTRGSESAQITEQHIENRSYNRDFYEGSEDYSVELRLYPRHPQELRARRGRVEADKNLAQYAVETRMAEIRREVNGAFVELQLKRREMNLLENHIQELNRDVALQEDLYTAGRIPLDRYADSRLDAIDARLDRDAVRTEADTLLDVLASRAGLADPGRIDLSGELAVTRISADELDVDQLIDLAWRNRRELGDLEQRDQVLAQDLALVKGGRIPWLSLISGQYTYQERYGGKYRDEYSIVAGFTIPVFSWFRDDDQLIHRSRQILGRDAQVARERIELDVSLAFRRLEQSRLDLSAYAEENQDFRKQLQDALEALPTDTPTAREQRGDLGQALTTLQTRELELTRAYARAVLRLEEVLGAPVGGPPPSAISTESPEKARPDEG